MTFSNEPLIPDLSVSSILETCRRIRNEFSGPVLVAVEVGEDAYTALFRLPRMELADRAHSLGLTGISVRLSHSLRPDIVVPILRDEHGEETWGEPFSIGGSK